MLNYVALLAYLTDINDGLCLLLENCVIFDRQTFDRIPGTVRNPSWKTLCKLCAGTVTNLNYIKTENNSRKKS